MIQFKFGFQYKGFMFGWAKRSLWRLPTTIHSRYYPAKKMNTINIGAGQGYRCVGDKLSISQLESMTSQFSKPVVVNKVRHKDVPF